MAGKKPGSAPSYGTRGNFGLETVSATWVQGEMTKDLKEVTRGRKDHNEVSGGEDLVDQEEAEKTGPRRS